MTVTSDYSFPTCNICGGSTFTTGPGGRRAANGSLPHCDQCDSLERHRASHSFFENFNPDFLNWRKALQISPDPACDPNWFKSYEVSIYEDGGIDLQKIDRSDASYDFITISHVLESVPDDRASINELKRVLSEKGFIHLILADPLKESSIDFESATGVFGFYHNYGIDFAERFNFNSLGLNLILIKSLDPITGLFEIIHLISKSNEVHQDLLNKIKKIEKQNGMTINSTSFHYILKE
jgi:hypothetical protein